MQDHKEGSSLQNQALQTLQERLHEADATLKREQESYKQMQVRGEILCVFSQYRGREGCLCTIAPQIIRRILLYILSNKNLGV
jgi:hypothetical protein